MQEEIKNIENNPLFFIKISLIKGVLPYKSEILTENLIKNIRLYLSPSLQIKNNWKLNFSIKENGRSFKNMIFMVKNKKPSILFLEEPNGNKIGVFFNYGLSHKLNKIGNYETSLFRLTKDNKFFWYNTTNLNNIYCFSCPEFLAFGCSEGKYGLLINQNMINGESNSVKTFSNEILSEEKYFQISKLEIWNIE